MSTQINWRDTYRPARFFMFDGRLLVLVLASLLHISWWTVTPTVICALVLWYFERRREISVVAAFRLVRSWLIGSLRPALSPYRTRRPVDYERRDQVFEIKNTYLANNKTQKQKKVTPK